MKSLFDQLQADEIRARLSAMRADSQRQWGTMSAAQAMAHCAISLETAVGDLRTPRMFIGRLIGRFIKPMMFADDASMRRNSPTAPSFVVEGDRDFDQERVRLRALIDRMAAAGPSGSTTHPHAFFGRLTPEQWGVLMYKHLDHHLRQFGS